MRRRIDARRVTRADVLVLAVLCVFLLMIVPALFARTREAEARFLCGSNLAQIGKAMLVYADDYEDELPRAGGRWSGWGAPIDWMAPDHATAFKIGLADTPFGLATISSCFCLLVKYMEMPPGSFVCKGDAGTSPWRLSDEPDVPPEFTLIDAWDFGAEPIRHCSYTYQLPFGLYALATSGDPNLAVAADRNPWIESPGSPPAVFAGFRPDCPPYSGTVGQARTGNSPSHQKDGQNVLFLDGHVAFETRAFCAVAEDNIYTVSCMPGKGDPYGMVPSGLAGASPANRRDSFLVHDPNEAFSPVESR